MPQIGVILAVIMPPAGSFGLLAGYTGAGYWYWPGVKLLKAMAPYYSMPMEDRKPMLAELLYGLTDEDLKKLLESKKMLWTIRLNRALASFRPSLSGNFVQIEPAEPIIEAVSEHVEPPNEPPPVYSEHEFLFVDEPGDAADDPPPVYSVPFIDPPACENMENAAKEPPPDEDFQPDGPFQGYNMEVF